MASITIFRNPFSSERETIQAESGMRISEVVTFREERSHVFVNGFKRDKAYILEAEDVVLIREYPADPITASAIIFAAVVTYIFTEVVVEAMTGKYLASYVIDKISNYFGINSDDPSALNSPETIKKTPQLRGSKNQLWGGKNVPLLLGEHLFTPGICGKPYTQIDPATDPDGEHPYLTILYILGYAPLIATDLRLGEMLLATNTALTLNGNIAIDGRYSNIDYGTILEIRDSAEVSLYPQKVVEDQTGGIKLLNTELTGPEYPIRFSASNVMKLEVEIMFGGLFRVNDDGSRGNATVTVRAQWRPLNGSEGSWVDLPGFTNATSFDAGISNFTRNEAKEMRFISTKTFTKSEMDLIPSGIVEIRVFRTNAQSTDTRTNDAVYWTATRSWCFDKAASTAAGTLVAQSPLVQKVREKTVRLGFRIYAKDDLNGTLDSLNMIMKSITRTWTGTEWTSKATAYANKSTSRNPAAVALSVLQGNNLGKNAYPDAKLDMAEFGRFYEFCATKGFTCNGVVTNDVKLENLIKDILFTGRAQKIMKDGLHSLFFDQPQAIPITILNNQNVISASNTKDFDKVPDGLKVSFVDEYDRYQMNEIYVMDDGKSSSDPDMEFLDVEFSFVTDRNHVWKLGRYILACLILRPEVWTRKVSIDGGRLPVGSLVEVQDDTLAVGLNSGGIIKAIVTAGGFMTGIIADSYFDMEAGKSYGIKVIQADGLNDPRIRLIPLVTNEGSRNALSFATPLSLSEDQKPGEEDIFSFGLVEKVTADALVVGYSTSDDGTYELSLVPYSDDLYDCDVGVIPEFDSKITPPVPSSVLDSFSPTQSQLETIADVVNPIIEQIELLPGPPGIGVESVDISYQVCTSGTTPPTEVWSSTPVATTAPGQWLWTRTITTYTDASTTTTYTNAAHGSTGPTGAQGASALGLGIILNSASFAAEGSNPGEVYIHGYNNDGTAADVNGFIVFKNSKVAITKGMVNPNVPIDGFLLAPKAGGAVIAGFFRIANQTWYNLNGGTPVALTESDYFAVGTIINTAGEVTESARLFPTGQDLVDVRTSIEAGYTGIAATVATGSGGVLIYQAISDTQFSASGIGARVRPGACVFVRGGTLVQSGASDATKALRVFDGYYWEAPRTESYEKYRQLAGLSLLAVARIYFNIGGSANVPTDCGTYIEFLIANKAVIGKLSSQEIQFLEYVASIASSTLMARSGSTPGTRQVYMGKNPRYPNDASREYEFAMQEYLGLNGSTEVWMKHFWTKFLTSGLFALTLSGCLQANDGVFSRPGRVWELLTAPTAVGVPTATGYGAGRWVVGGDEGGLVYTLDNGESFTTISSPFTGTPQITVVKFGADNRWIIGTNDGRLAYSTNGSSFTLCTHPFLATDYITDAVFGNGRWVVTGGSKIAYSDNGTSFSAGTSPFGTSTIFCIEHYDGKYIAGGSSGKLAVSTNGSVFSIIPSTPFGTSIIKTIRQGNGWWVAAGYDGKIGYSANGQNFTLAYSPFGTTTINSITNDSSQWVAVGFSGKIATTTDVRTWSSSDINQPFGTYVIMDDIDCTENSVFLAVGHVSGGMPVIIRSEPIEAGGGVVGKVYNSVNGELNKLWDGRYFKTYESADNVPSEMQFNFSQSTTEATVYSAISPLISPTVNSNSGCIGTINGMSFTEIYRDSTTALSFRVPGVANRRSVGAGVTTQLTYDLQIILLPVINI